MRRERRQRPFAKQPVAPVIPSKPSPVMEARSAFNLGDLKVTPKPEAGTRRKTKSKTPVRLYFFLFLLLIAAAIYHQLPVFFSALHYGTPSSSTNSNTQATKTNLRRSEMLPKPGEYAPIRSDTIIPLVKLWKAPCETYHIFSISDKEDMPFTILTNILMGLFDEPDYHLGILKWSAIGNQYLTRHKNEWTDNNITIVSHTIATDSALQEVTQLQREFRSTYRNLFFILVDQGQCNNPLENVMLCIKPTDLTYQGIEDEKVVIERVTTKIIESLPYFSKIDFTLPKIEALRRLSFMDDMQLQMRDLPKTSSETKYGIKGGTDL